MRKNRYFALRLKILAYLFLNGKMTARKLFNALGCYLAHGMRMKRSARYPFAINFELWNECNANCAFCRTESGEIYDQNPEGGRGPIPKGRMPYEMFTAVIDEVKGHLLMAILYLNGEPLMYRDIYKAIRYASDRRVATMISTNGVLLNGENTGRLLDSGLDFIKIAIAGFSQGTYKLQNRSGDIETVKENLKTLSRLKKESSSRLLVMVDYMLYAYNKDEVEEARKFCDALGFILNVRPGNVKGLKAAAARADRRYRAAPAEALCDSLWKLVAINWNGDLLPCCDYAVWSASKAYARFEPGKTAISDVWNGREAVSNRVIHMTKGRRAIPTCAECPRQGIYFAY